MGRKNALGRRGIAALMLMAMSQSVAAPAYPATKLHKHPNTSIAYGPPMSAHPAAPRAGMVGPPIPPEPAATAPPVSSLRNVCLEQLATLGTRFQTGEGQTQMQAGCPISEPVRLESIRVSRGQHTEIVRLVAPPLLACDTALAVTEWVQGSIAPLTRGHFDEALLEIGVGGGYECRTRNHQPQAPRSEHSYGRALDLMSFRTATRIIKVEKIPPAEVRRFLDAVWASACGQFATALGPEADAFHATHIHVDQQPRKSASSKFCE